MNFLKKHIYSVCLGVTTLSFLIAFYVGLYWGSKEYHSLILYVIVVVMAVVLVDVVFAWMTVGLIIASFLLTTQLQASGYIMVHNIRSGAYIGSTDIVLIPIMYIGVILFLLVFRQAQLRRERDALEVAFERRTKELRETKQEKMNTLYRFAEFGKLSSGLFHDLMNPLTALTLTIEQASQNTDATHAYLERAHKTAKRMERFIAAIKTQIRGESTRQLFHVCDEIYHVLSVLAYKASKVRVTITSQLQKGLMLYGDPIKFNQAILNLVSNAIDAYDGSHDTERIVHISLVQEGNTIICKVQDNGVGVPSCIVEKIFEPFFSTKDHVMSSGVGLSITKAIIEKDFAGALYIDQCPGVQTVFVAKVPIHT